MVLHVYRQPHVLMGSKSESMKEVSVTGWLELLTFQWIMRDNWDRVRTQAEDHNRLKKGELNGLQGR